MTLVDIPKWGCVNLHPSRSPHSMIPPASTLKGLARLALYGGWGGDADVITKGRSLIPPDLGMHLTNYDEPLKFRIIQKGYQRGRGVQNLISIRRRGVHGLSQLSVSLRE